MEAVDQKTLLLNEKYGDNVYVATTMRELEDIRNQATNLGILTSLSAFGLNEVARLTLRSRKCKSGLIHSIINIALLCSRVVFV